MNKRIMVTGGLGFIGSHIVVELLEQNYNVIIVDNLSNSKKQVLYKIHEIVGTKQTKVDFYKIDLLDKISLENIFIKYNYFDYVIHLAGLKAVSESIDNPLLYYRTNIDITLNVLELMNKYNCYNLIFSSSATVYGNQSGPFIETMVTGQNISNPYGKSKYLIEEILKDLVKTNQKWTIIILRYFNPIGSHTSSKIGEDPNNIPNNLMPYILKTASKQYPCLNIYGNNYLTRDGTCIRDFIHVVDLAKGHLISMKDNIENGIHIYNLGTGKGTTVLELIKEFIRINKIDIPYKFIEKRDGDLTEVYADSNKAKNKLGWVAKLGIEEMVRDAYNYQKNNCI
jgi:UDP-glucose 4-epimerase